VLINPIDTRPAAHNAALPLCHLMFSRTVIVNITVFLGVTTCSLVDTYHHFTWLYWHYTKTSDTRCAPSTLFSGLSASRLSPVSQT